MLVNGITASGSALIRELGEFEIKRLRLGTRHHAGQAQMQGCGQGKFYSIAQVGLQYFLFIPTSEGNIRYRLGFSDLGGSTRAFRLRFLQWLRTLVI